MDRTTPHWHVVTKEQVAAGYTTLVNVVVRHHEYIVLDKQRDGTYLVVAAAGPAAHPGWREWTLPLTRWLAALGLLAIRGVSVLRRSSPRMTRMILLAALLLATVSPAVAVPLLLPQPGHLVAPACRWTFNLNMSAEGPVHVGCRVVRAQIGAVDPNIKGPVGSPESPGGRMWFTVESRGQVWQEERWAKGWDTEDFVLPFIQGPTRITFATERELRMYEFNITQPPEHTGVGDKFPGGPRPPVSTPDPATLLMIGASAVGVAWWRKRRGR